MYCTKCGTRAEEGDVYCGSCGNSLRPKCANVSLAAPTSQDDALADKLARERVASALVLMQQGDHRQAADNLAAALKDLPDDAEAWASLGVCHAALFESEKAIEAFQIAVQMNPNLSNAWGALGNQYFCSGRTDEAIHALEQAVELNHQNAQAWGDLGGAYAEKGDYNRAALALEEALRVDQDQSASGASIRAIWKTALFGIKTFHR